MRKVRAAVDHGHSFDRAARGPPPFRAFAAVAAKGGPDVKGSSRSGTPEGGLTMGIREDEASAPIEGKSCERAPGPPAPSATLEVSKVVDLIIGKQTQFYTLWGVYTAVQFAAGSFGSGHKVSSGAASAVLLGVWAFNLGHLGFLLQCLKQINELRAALRHGLDRNEQRYRSELKVALGDLQQGDFFWRFYRLRDGRGGYIMNSVVHFFIDACASLALISRMDNRAPSVGIDFF